MVDHAGDGEEALARVRRENPTTSIICDLEDAEGRRDAVLSGDWPRPHPDVARRVIFVTGDVAGTDAERFLQESGCRWLAKPFRLGDLLRAVPATFSP